MAQYSSVKIRPVSRLADKQAKPCLLACLGSKQAIKQEASFWAIKQAKEGLACLLAYFQPGGYHDK